MKKIVSFIAAVAALGSVSTAFSQVKENKEVTHMGAGVVANQNTSYSPTVTQLGGNVVEYREYTPEFSLSLLGVSAAVGYESEYVFRGDRGTQFSRNWNSHIRFMRWTCMRVRGILLR